MSTGRAPSTTLSTTGDSRSSRPIVVIAGWVGCKVESLSKYTELYESLGFSVFVYIASPYMVFNAALPILLFPPSSETAEAKGKAETTSNNYDDATFKTTTMDQVDSNSDCSTRGTKAHSINELAFEIVQKLIKVQENHHYNQSNSNCVAEIFFHVFSNGGCFLWEAIHDILITRQSEPVYANITKKISGIIYDSAPANYAGTRSSNLIYQAMKYCTLQEQLELKSTFFLQCLHFGYKETLENRHQRSLNFWNKMKTNPMFNIPSLYLFSDIDTLTPFESLLSLVHYRQDMFRYDQTSNYDDNNGDHDRNDHQKLVKYVIFDNSSHCRHILSNPELYISSVKAFVTQNSKYSAASSVRRRQQRWQQEQHQSQQSKNAACRTTTSRSFFPNLSSRM